jgi:hypothetical protein
LYSNGTRGPARRDHAATTLSRYMLIQGGIQQGNTHSNDFYLYNMEQDGWCEMKMVGVDKPYLSHHKIVSTYKKGRKMRY